MNLRDRWTGFRKIRLDQRSQCVARRHAGRHLVEIDRRALVTQLHDVFAIRFVDLRCQSDYPEAGQFFWSTVTIPASARCRGQVGTNWSPARDCLRRIKRHRTRDGGRGSLGQVQLSKRPAFCGTGNNRRQVGRKPALPLQLAGEQFGVVNQPMALLFELIEPAQIFFTINSATNAPPFAIARAAASSAFDNPLRRKSRSRPREPTCRLG